MYNIDIDNIGIFIYVHAYIDEKVACLYRGRERDNGDKSRDRDDVD